MGNKCLSSLNYLNCTITSSEREQNQNLTSQVKLKSINKISNGNVVRQQQHHHHLNHDNHQPKKIENKVDQVAIITVIEPEENEFSQYDLSLSYDSSFDQNLQFPSHQKPDNNDDLSLESEPVISQREDSGPSKATRVSVTRNMSQNIFSPNNNSSKSNFSRSKNHQNNNKRHNIVERKSSDLGDKMSYYSLDSSGSKNSSITY